MSQPPAVRTPPARQHPGPILRVAALTFVAVAVIAGLAAGQDSAHDRVVVLGIALATAAAGVAMYCLAAQSIQLTRSLATTSDLAAEATARYESTLMQTAQGLAAQQTLQSDVELHRRRFELIVQHSTDVISILGRHGEWLYSSPAGTRLLGYPETHHPVGGILSLVHPDDMTIALTALQEVVDGTRTANEPVVFRVQSASGEWRTFETLGVNMVDDPIIRGVLIMSRDVTDRQRLTDLLAHAAMHDPLTDLLNRTALAEQIDAALARSTRTNTNVAACFIDLDRFKPVNDRYGHSVGDEVLVEAASRLRTVVRAGDIVARVGGDEFVVLCESFVDPVDAACIAERIADALNEPYRSAAGLIECGASIGVAWARPGEEQTQLLARADEALYQAKAAGRRCVAFDVGAVPPVRASGGAGTDPA